MWSVHYKWHFTLIINKHKSKDVGSAFEQTATLDALNALIVKKK